VNPQSLAKLCGLDSTDSIKDSNMSQIPSTLLQCEKLANERRTAVCVCGVLQGPRHPSTSSFSRHFAKAAMMQQCAAMYLVATTSVCAVAAAVDLSVSRAVPPSPSASSYRLFVATCGIGELEPMLLTVVQPTSKGRSEVPTATLTQFGPVVGTVGSASKWVVEHPLHSVLVSCMVLCSECSHCLLKRK
jgi:hypothetical protein